MEHWLIREHANSVKEECHESTYDDLVNRCFMGKTEWDWDIVIIVMVEEAHLLTWVDPRNRNQRMKYSLVLVPCYIDFDQLQLSTMDVLVPSTMKNAAKCDTSYELHYFVNHQNFERILRYQDFPGSILVWVLAYSTRFMYTCVHENGIWICVSYTLFLNIYACATLKWCMCIVSLYHGS